MRKQLSRQSAAGLRHSPMCGTVHENGGFDYRLHIESDDKDVREVSEECVRSGLPATGYIDPDRYIYHEDRVTLI